MPFKSKFFRSQLNGLKRWQGHGILLEKECIWGECAIFLKTNCHPFFRPLNFKLKMIGALLHSLCFLLLINRDLGAPQFDTRSKCFSSLCRRGIFDKNFSATKEQVGKKIYKDGLSFDLLFEGYTMPRSSYESSPSPVLGAVLELDRSIYPMISGRK